MSISTITQPPFLVTTFSELDVSWPDGSFGFVSLTNVIYRLSSGVWMAIKSNYLFKPYSVSTTSGSAIIYLTDDGLITGNALFSSIDYVHLDFILNDPNLGKSYTITNSNKTLTITAVKQTFTGVVVLGVNVLGSVTIPAAANGTALTVLVQGIPV